MKKNVRIAVCFLLCMLLTVVSGNKVQASSGLNVDYHSQDEIRQMAEVLNIQQDFGTEYSEKPLQTPPYSAGKLAESTVQNGLNTLNMIRYVAGIPYNVKSSDTYAKKAQAGAVVNWANGMIDHKPSKPNGMDDALYQLGKEGAGASNLAMGFGNLYQAIMDGWMADSDSSNIDRVGHRRWCLNPGMEYTGFGIVGRYYAMYSFDGAFTNKGYTGVAWPAQNMPVEFFETRWSNAMPWSISMGKSVNPGSVHVTLTRKNDGEVWNFSASGAEGEFFVNNDSYGQSGCIIFRPSGIREYKDGDSFHVEIEGAGTPVSYDVNFFSMHKHQGGKATCQMKAVCSICGKEYGELAGHQYEKVIGREATCTEKGLEYEKCIFCQKVNKDSYRDIPEKGHSWGSWKTERKGTYDREGIEARVCKSCAKKEKRTLPMIPKLGKVVSARVDSLTVTWNKVRGADGYRIYVKSGKHWKYLTEVKGNVTSYRHEGLESGTAYTYTVRAYKDREPKKTYSGYNTKGITGTTILPTPQLKNVKSYRTCIKMTWEKVTGASGYIVYRKTGSGRWSKIAVIDSGSTIGYADKNVKNGTAYTYTVRAYKKVNGKNVYSSYDKDGKSAVKTLGL